MGGGGVSLDGSHSFWTNAAVLQLLEVLEAACGFPEWGHWGSEGATGPWV